MAQSSVQHYVPQCLLRAFSDADGNVHAFDKATRATFASNPRNVAGERGFYDLPMGEKVDATVEKHLSRLEGEAEGVLARVRARREIGFLDRREHETLAHFAAVQFVRTRHHREMMKDMAAQLRAILADRFPGAKLPAGLEMSDDDAKAMNIMTLADTWDSFTPHFLSKALVLIEAAQDACFALSDNPVVRFNTSEPRPPIGSNLGLSVRGVEIYLPISSGLMLGFYCKSIAERVLKGYYTAHAARDLVDQAGIDLCELGYLADGFRYGYPIPSDAEHMAFFNSLQVINAERWVFTTNGDFSLVTEMLQSKPHLARGARMKVN
jgi:hypothetical protein